MLNVIDADVTASMSDASRASRAVNEPSGKSTAK